MERQLLTVDGESNLRKVCYILQAFENAGRHIDYYALDVSQKELERTLAQVPAYQYVSCHGLLGTYDDGRDWLEQATNVDRPKCILHLGSSIGKVSMSLTNAEMLSLTWKGNFDLDGAVDFLAGFAKIMRPADRMVVGVDSCADPTKV